MSQAKCKPIEIKIEIQGKKFYCFRRKRPSERDGKICRLGRKPHAYI